MGRAGVAVLVALGVGGCAAPHRPVPNQVLDAIQREAAIAARPAPAPAAAIEQALLPPLNAAPTESRFDISVQNAPAGQVFMAIVGGTPYSMVVPPDVTGTLTLSLKGVTVGEVLDAIRDQYGYDYKVQGNRVTIVSNTVQTRMFQVNYLAGRRQGGTSMSLASTSITGGGASSSAVPSPAGGTAGGGGGSSGGSGSRISLNFDSDFWNDVKQAITGIIGSGGGGRSVNYNPSAGVILVRATPAELREVERYLKEIQLVVERQVMLEAKIIDVTLNESYQSGVNWAAFKTGPNSNVALGAQGNTTMRPSGTLTGLGATAVTGARTGSMSSTLGFYGLAFQSANFAAMLGFLEGQGTVHVLSSPRVATLNNQKAVLKVGNDEYFVTNVATTTTTGTGATTTSPSVTLQPFFSGISLDVTPQIDANDQIILHVHPSISTVSEKVKNIDLGAGGTLSLPLATSAINESDSIVRVRDGNIVAIGGLMRQRQTQDSTQLPGTGEKAGSGLFGQRTRSLVKSELVILIKPTIIRDDADWKEGMEEVAKRLSEYAPPGPVNIVRPQ